VRAVPVQALGELRRAPIEDLARVERDELLEVVRHSVPEAKVADALGETDVRPLRAVDDVEHRLRDASARHAVDGVSGEPGCGGIHQHTRNVVPNTRQERRPPLLVLREHGVVRRRDPEEASSTVDADLRDAGPGHVSRVHLGDAQLGGHLRNGAFQTEVAHRRYRDLEGGTGNSVAAAHGPDLGNSGCKCLRLAKRLADRIEGHHTGLPRERAVKGDRGRRRQARHRDHHRGNRHWRLRLDQLHGATAARTNHLTTRVAPTEPALGHARKNLCIYREEQ